MSKRHDIWDVYKLLKICSEQTNEIFKLITALGRVKNLAKQHRRMCENDCNGAGYIPRKGMFYNGKIDAYARKQYGANVQSSYRKDSDDTVWDEELKKIEHKINYALNDFGWIDRSFQYDPRGATVKIWIPGPGKSAYWVDLDLF